jgi:hypothetical protein
VTAAILGVLGFATLFAVAGMIPLEKRSCHGECSAESAADCHGCPFGPEITDPEEGARHER